MLGQYQSMGCASMTDTQCLCGKQNFEYGIRDCATQACLNPDGSENTTDAGTVVDFGKQLCAGASGANPGATTTVSRA